LSSLLCGSIAALAMHGAAAHHAVESKFDGEKPMSFDGVVTRVDWRNPHVHVFVDIEGNEGVESNWAVELESPVLLERSGWKRDALRPGDAVSVSGIVARNGTRQIWGED